MPVRMLDVRRWEFYPIEMPIDADGNGPATIGRDACSMTYEVWDGQYRSHASFTNLPDAINEAIRLSGLAATVIEQHAEIERLRGQLGILWSWCRNWDAEFIYDDEFDRSAIESLLGATQ